MNTKWETACRREKCRDPGTGLIRMTAIRRLARQIAEQFEPETIYLFGSYVYGSPNEHSDVDILVVMPTRNEGAQVDRIRQQTDHPFPLDLIVHTPKKLAWRLKAGDWFLREIVSRGKVLHAKADQGMGSQG